MPSKKSPVRTNAVVTRGKPAVNREQQVITALSSVLEARQLLAARLGKSHGGLRDLYAVCGYPQVLTSAMYQHRFERDALAGRILTAYPKATWRTPPIIYESDKRRRTGFEKAVQELMDPDATDSLDIVGTFRRADVLCGLGEYAILVLGFNDSGDLSKPVNPKKANPKLLYVQPYRQEYAKVDTVDADPVSARYGLPQTYSIQTNIETLGGTADAKMASKPGVGSTMKVHWSRVVHLAQGTLDNTIIGVPVLRNVYNRLHDAEQVVGCTSETFWQAAFGGIAFNADPDAEFQTSDAELEAEIEKYVHGLKRYLRLQGVEAKTLDAKMADPKSPMSVILMLISAATNIPVRILVGSESGELASSQDESNWRDRVSERRGVASGWLKEFVKRCQYAGVLPASQRIVVQWPETDNENRKERVANARTEILAIAEYMRTPGIEQILPPKVFLSEVLHWSDARAEAAIADGKLFKDKANRIVPEDQKAVQPTVEGSKGGDSAKHAS